MEKHPVPVQLEKVTKIFRDPKSRSDVYAVRDAELQIESGELVTLLGPSGCGKTTMLRMVGGFELPTHGRIRIGGEDVTYLPPNARATATVCAPLRERSAASGPPGAPPERPVTAATSCPNASRSAIATEPTPPEAPVTRTSPAAGVSPCSSSAMIESIAVRPAVPSSMASRRLRPLGRLITQAAGTRMYWPKPPAVIMPRS